MNKQLKQIKGIMKEEVKSKKVLPKSRQLKKWPRGIKKIMKTELYRIFYGKFQTALMEAKDLNDAYISARVKFGKEVVVILEKESNENIVNALIN